MLNLYFLPIEETIDALVFDKLCSLVSDERRRKKDHLRLDIDKKTSIYADILLRVIICRTLKIKNRKIVIEKEEYGRPYLKGYPDFHFSISHTRKAIVLATSNLSVGVDIEEVRNNRVNISNRFFTKTEQFYISKDEHDANRRFYEIWTKKEAYVKYLGLGLSLPLNSFCVFNSKMTDYFSTFELKDYYISIYTEEIKPKIKVIELNEDYVNWMAFYNLM